MANPEVYAKVISTQKSLADFQSLHRHLQLAQPVESTNFYHGQIDNVSPSDGNTYSNFPSAGESELRLMHQRSLAPFASYPGTHHSTIPHSRRPEWPSIDWSNLNILYEKVNFYKPDTELMCTTITTQLLANPSADLLEQHNTFLLHLIEIYHQSKADMQTLPKMLAERTECDESTVDRFPERTSFQPLEKPDLLQSLRNVDSNTLHSI